MSFNRRCVVIRTIDNDSKNIFVHRLVATLFCEKYKDTDTIINHINSDPSCNIYSNLEWCDYKYNAKDAYDKKRMSYPISRLHGTCNPSNKYSVNDILNIYKMRFELKYSINDIKTITGMSKEHVRKITKGILWADLYNAYKENHIDKYLDKIKKEDAELNMIRNIKDMILGGKSSSEIINVIKSDYNRNISKDYISKLRYRLLHK